MSIARVQVVLNKKSGIPRDAVTNTYHVDAGVQVSEPDYDGIVTAFAALYNSLGTDNILALTLSRAASAHRIKISNLGEWPGGPITPAGPPDRDSAFTIGGAGSSAYPAPVAIAVTLEAGSERHSQQVGATRPAARRRGRVYLGPIGSLVVAHDSLTSEAYLDAGIRTTILNRFTTLQSQLAALAAPVALTVLSRTGQLNTPVEDFSIDDSFDTIRRRKVRARSRVRASAVPVALGA